MEKETTELYVVVTLLHVHLPTPSNYFATLKIDFNPASTSFLVANTSTTHRTEVQKDTKDPSFKTRTFSFKIPSTPTYSVADLLLYSPVLYLQLFEVTRKEKDGPNMCGAASLFLSREYVDSLLRTRALRHSLFLYSEGEKPAGQCEIEVSLTDTPAPGSLPASPRSPAAAAGPVMSASPLPQVMSPSPIPIDDDEERFIYTLIIHGGVNLGTQRAPPPSPFVTAKTTRDAAAKKQAKTATSMAKNARNVIWNERLVVAMSRRDLDSGQGIFLAVIDYNTKRYIGKGIIPVQSIRFGEQYHLRLLLPEDTGYILVSITLEDKMGSEITRYLNDSNLYHIEILLKGLQVHIPGDPRAMIAVLQIVDDDDEYKSKVHNTLAQRVPFTPVSMTETHGTFPLFPPHIQKISPISLPNSQPVWNHLFDYSIQKQRFANPSFSLIIEFYYLDLTVITANPTSPVPMTPMSPIPPASPVPVSPNNRLANNNGQFVIPEMPDGLVFWGYTSLPLAGFLQERAHTVTVSGAELPISGLSTPDHNTLLVDITRQDAHDYMKYLSIAKERAALRSKPGSRTRTRDMVNSPGISPSASPHGRMLSPALSPTASPTPIESPIPLPPLSPLSPRTTPSPSPSSATSSPVSNHNHQTTQHPLHIPQAQKSVFTNLTIVPPPLTSPVINLSEKFSNSSNSSNSSTSSSNTSASSTHRRNNSETSKEVEQMHKALQQQQEIIEKLLSERQGVKEALSRVERDITQLREEKENESIVKSVSISSIPATPVTPATPTTPATPAPEHDPNEAENAAKLLAERAVLEEKLEEVIRTQGHLSSLVQNLQSENAKIPKYVQTAKQQEKVIQKLEALLKYSVHEMKKAQKFQTDLQKAKEDNRRLEKELQSAKKQVNELQHNQQQHQIQLTKLNSQHNTPTSSKTHTPHNNNNTNNNQHQHSLQHNTQTQQNSYTAIHNAHNQYIEKTELAEQRIKKMENEMAKNTEVLVHELHNLKTKLQDQEHEQPQQQQYNLQQPLHYQRMQHSPPQQQHHQQQEATPTKQQRNTPKSNRNNANSAKSPPATSANSTAPTTPTLGQGLTPKSPGNLHTRPRKGTNDDESSSSGVQISGPYEVLTASSGSSSGSSGSPSLVSSMHSHSGEHTTGSSSANTAYNSVNAESMAMLSKQVSVKVKAKRMQPVKHKETGEYRRPHMLLPINDTL